MGKAKEQLKLLVGRAAEIALPGLVREIDEARKTQRAPRLKRAILYARIRRAQARGDIAEVERTLNTYWRGDESWYYESYVEERFSFFREHHALVLDALSRLTETAHPGFSRLVEIGCGDGKVLAYAAKRLPSVREVIGIDINAAAIARNSARPPEGEPLRFINADARDWLDAHPQAGTIALTNNGVLEYFSQESLDRLLRALAQAPPAAIALIEPLDPEHDLRTRPDSYVYGWERAFSHNHRARLSEAGFEVAFEQEMNAGNLRWMLMIGRVG